MLCVQAQSTHKYDAALRTAMRLQDYDDVRDTTIVYPGNHVGGGWGIRNGDAVATEAVRYAQDPSTNDVLGHPSQVLSPVELYSLVALVSVHSGPSSITASSLSSFRTRITICYAFRVETGPYFVSG